MLAQPVVVRTAANIVEVIVFIIIFPFLLLTIIFGHDASMLGRLLLCGNIWDYFFRL